MIFLGISASLTWVGGTAWLMTLAYRRGIEDRRHLDGERRRAFRAGQANANADPDINSRQLVG